MRNVALATLVENCSCSYGEEPNEGNRTYGVVKVSNVDAEGNFHREFEQRTFLHNALKNLLVRSGDLLVVKSSGSKTNVLSGKTALCKDEHEGNLVASNFLLRLRPDPDQVWPKYLWYYLNSKYSKEFVLKVVGATTYPNLKWETYSDQPIPIPHKDGKPDVAEQKRIAAILDKADAIRRKLQQSLRLSDDFLRSVFLDMFGDPVTNPKGWPLRTLTSVIGDSFRNGLSPSTSGTVAGKVLTLSAITSGTFAPQFLKDAIFDRIPSENQQVTRNTFLICRGNGNKSMVGIGVFPEADMPAVSFPDTMIACTIDRTQIEPEYLQAVWATAKIRTQIDAGARTTNGTYKVNQTLLGGIEFPLPPPKLQTKFSTITRAIRCQSAKTSNLAAESETLFSSLQQRAFRGEL